MKIPTLAEFVESKYSEEIHRAIIEDSVRIEITNKMVEFGNTWMRPCILPIPGVDANANRYEVEEYKKKLEEFENNINIRVMQVKKDIIKNKLNSDSTVRAEYMKYIIENFGDSESLKAMALMLYGEAAIRMSECQPFADVSIQPKFNIADKHPKEFVFRDGRMEDIIRELGFPIAERQLKRMIEKDESAYESN